jgi:hypothetical protein
VSFLLLEDSHSLWEFWNATVHAGSDLALKRPFLGETVEFIKSGQLFRDF